MLLGMWRTMMVAVAAAVVVVSLGAGAGACLFDAVELEDAIDPSHERGSRTVGIIERRTVEAAPYLGLSGPRSMSAIARSWGQLPDDTTPRIDRGGCGLIPLPKDTKTYFAVLDDGSMLRVYIDGPTKPQLPRADVERIIEDRFGLPEIHNVGLITGAWIVARLWLLPLLVPLLALVAAAVVDRRRGHERSMRPLLAVAAVAVAVVLGVALSFPDPGWATARFVAGFLGLAALALWLGKRGDVTTVVLVMGTVLFGVGSGTLVGRTYAAATAALGIALLIEGLAIHATASLRPMLRIGHISVIGGAALIAGSIWLRGTQGGENSTITVIVVLAVAVAAVWSWQIEHRLIQPGTPRIPAAVEH